MELPIWQRWFCCVGSSCITEAIHWSHPWHRVEKWIFWNFGVSAFIIAKLSWNFLRHWAAAVTVLKTYNISPVCRHIIEIWPVMIACNWENCVLLAAFWYKISKFHLGSGPSQAPRYMICVKLFCTLHESNTRPCENRENTKRTRNTCDFRMAVCSLTRATCKNVRQNLIPRATA